MSRARHAARSYPATRPIGGRGCLPAFVLAPLTVLVFGAGFLVFPPDPVPLVASAQPAPGPTDGISPVFTPEVQYWMPSILRWAAQSGTDPNLVAVIMQIESCGDPGATSRAGALGLFQVMPYHFQSGEDPYAPDVNALRAMAYLKRALAASHNDVRLALAGYNGGISIISKPEWFWPDESSRYAYWGGGIYTDIVGGAATSARLNEWLAAGGSSLCRRADQVLHLST